VDRVSIAFLGVLGDLGGEKPFGVVSNASREFDL